MDATSTATNHLQQQPETNGKISLANGNGHISSNGNINHNTNNNHVATNNIHSSSNNNANNSSSNNTNTNTNTMIANIPATSYASLHSPSPTPSKGCCCKNHILVITILCVYLALVFIIFSNIFLDDSRGRSNSSNNNGNNLKHKSQINSVDAQNQNDRQQNFYYYLLNHVF